MRRVLVPEADGVELRDEGVVVGVVEAGAWGPVAPHVHAAGLEVRRALRSRPPVLGENGLGLGG